MSVLAMTANSQLDAIAIGYANAPEAFKPLYDRHVADKSTDILQQIFDNKMQFSQLADAYKAKLISEIQGKLPDYWVKLDEEYQCRVDGSSFIADEISSSGLNGWDGDPTIVDFCDLDISDLEYIKQNIIAHK